MNSLLTLFLLSFVAFTFADQCLDVNEEHRGCGTACPTTCGNMNQLKRLCTEQCVSGCFCKEPYVRDQVNGNCVLKTKCIASHVCAANEIYQTCGTDCPLTCKNYKIPPRVCDAVCRVGCFCEHGLVRDDASGKCVATKDCPQ